MTNDERDEVRRILVAFEDAGIWCEQLAEREQQLIRSIQQNRIPSGPDLSAELTQIAETLRHLQDDRHAVEVIRKRIGLAPVSV
jgi:hypothetical protein